MDIKELQLHIAKNCGVDEGTAGIFVDSIKHVIKSGLDKDGEVLISGFGVFKLIRFKNRKQTQLFFYPDEKYKKGVNSAFELFSPVVFKEALPTNAKTDCEIEPEISVDIVLKVETSENENQNDNADVLLSESENDIDMNNDDDLRSKPGENTFFSSRSGAIIVIVVLAIAIAFTIWYFFFRMENANKPPVEVQPVEEIVSNPVLEPKVLAEKQYAEKESDANNSLKILSKHKVLEGERYTLLSEKYYGNKFYWPYIYEANKDRFPNPAVVYKLEYIDIPDLISMGIDLKDPQSLVEAKSRGAQLMKVVEGY